MNRPYTSQIPHIEDTEALSETIRKQLTDAIKKPEEFLRASQCYKIAIKRDDAEWIWHYYLGYLYLEMGER